VPLLQEYFYNDGERLHAVLGDAFVKGKKASPGTVSALGADLYDSETLKHEICELEGDEFIGALKGLAG
jgi:hypothetical protein